MQRVFVHPFLFCCMFHSVYTHTIEEGIFLLDILVVGTKKKSPGGFQTTLLFFRSFFMTAYGCFSITTILTRQARHTARFSFPSKKHPHIQSFLFFILSLLIFRWFFYLLLFHSFSLIFSFCSLSFFVFPFFCISSEIDESIRALGVIYTLAVGY